MNRLKAQLKTTPPRLFLIIGIGYLGYLGTQIFDGFLNKNMGQVAGYWCALTWFGFWVLNDYLHRRMTKELLELVKTPPELHIQIGTMPQQQKRSPQGGIPSPFKRLF